MLRRITTGLAALALVLAGAVAPAAAAPGDPGKLVGYSDAADGPRHPIYEDTPPKLSKAQKAANLKKMSKGVEGGIKAPPPSPHAQASKRAAGPPWYHWAGGRQNTTVEGLFANCNIWPTPDPYLRPVNVPTPGAPADEHSLCELAMIKNDFVANRDIVEIGWTKDKDPAICPAGSRCLFGSQWTGGVFGGYNANFVDYAPNPNNLGMTLPTTCGTGNTRFGIQYSAGDWWLWLDVCTGDATPGDYVGYFDGSLWPGGFTVAGTASAFGEVASLVDSNPCTDGGNGDTPTALGTAARVGTVQLINAAAAANFTMYSNSTSHGSVPQAYTAVASNTPTTTYRYGGPGYTAANALPGVNGGC